MMTIRRVGEYLRFEDTSNANSVCFIARDGIVAILPAQEPPKEPGGESAYVGANIYHRDLGGGCHSVRGKTPGEIMDFIQQKWRELPDPLRDI